MHFSEKCFDPTPLLLEAWEFHPGPSVNPLYSKCKISKFSDNIKLSNFLFAHDSIKSNLPTSFCASITTNIPILQKSRSKSGKYSYCENKNQWLK